MVSGGIWRPLRVYMGVYIRATLRHFEHKVRSAVKTALLIPCERRLAETEIPEIQEATFGTRFGK